MKDQLSKLVGELRQKVRNLWTMRPRPENENSQEVQPVKKPTKRKTTK